MCIKEGRSLVDAVTLSGILKVKQKLGVTSNFDKQDVIEFVKSMPPSFQNPWQPDRN